MAALDTSSVGGRRFYDEWLQRHFQNNNGLSNIDSIPESLTPPDEDGPFEYVDEKMESQDMEEGEDEWVSEEDGLVNGGPSSMSVAPAMNQETNSSLQDVGGVYTL